MSFLQPVFPHALHALSVLSGDLMVAANKGVQAGWLVPLSAGLCYLGKQGSFMPLSSISRVRSTRLVTVRWWLTRAKSCADLVPFWALQRLSFLVCLPWGTWCCAHMQAQAQQGSSSTPMQGWTQPCIWSTLCIPAGLLPSHGWVVSHL